jgi:hypothetical protein
VLSMFMDVFVKMFGWNLRFFHNGLEFTVSRCRYWSARLNKAANRELLTVSGWKVYHKRAQRRLRSGASPDAKRCPAPLVVTHIDSLLNGPQLRPGLGLLPS